MPQKRIPLEPGQMYHIWTHANGDDNLFRSNENYPFFLERYSHYIPPIADTFAYCLMPNHLHLMVRIKGEVEVLEYLRTKGSNPDPTLQGFKTLGGFSRVISHRFSHLFNSYTQSFNKYYGRKGSLFIPNFKRKKIHSDSYFATLIAYIHYNPVHHGFTKHPAEWPHSSWHAYVQQRKTRIRREEAIEWFGSRQEFFRAHRKIRIGKLETLFEE
jgi:REP element-mobilizing transposase RayT